MTARILVVDDIAANLRLLEAKLQGEYYEVALAESGAEALRLAATWLPDIILLDVMMPGMDGYETCRRLKADPQLAHIPVVMVTALTEQAERIRGLEAGADDFLSKPVDDATLFARIRALMRTKQVLDAWRLRAETARELGLEPLPGPEDSLAGARAALLGPADEVAAMQAALQAEGMLTEVHATPEEAFRAITSAPPDLAVLSLDRAAEEEVLRLISRLRAALPTRDLPILLAAGPAAREWVLRAFDIGATDLVQTPIDPHELRARARNQIRRKRYQEQLRADLDRGLTLAVTDPLTGLRNRRYIRHHLEAQLRQGPAGVLMIDLDHFKAINDAHGHAMGDAALCEVAARLRDRLRAADALARWGGEEFLVVLAGAPTAQDCLPVAERLLQAVRATPITVDGLSLPCTCSIGAAAGPAGSDADRLIEAADLALYAAKKAGRNCVRLAPPIPPPAAAPPAADRPEAT